MVSAAALAPVPVWGTADTPPHPATLPRLQTLSGMSASDELDDSQVRQMLFDLESAYNAFNRFLHA